MAKLLRLLSRHSIGYTFLEFYNLGTFNKMTLLANLSLFYHHFNFRLVLSFVIYDRKALAQSKSIIMMLLDNLP